MGELKWGGRELSSHEIAKRLLLSKGFRFVTQKLPRGTQGLTHKAFPDPALD
jgi:hypothetical protein